MTRPPRILVLVHEYDGYPGRQVHFVWPLAERWRANGIDVRIAHGPEDPVARQEFDAILPHVNVSVTPPTYRAYLDRRTNVLNAYVYDITKRRISANLVGEADDWPGPVIVKTDRNYGGLPEMALLRRARERSLGRRIVRRFLGPARSEPRPVPLEQARTLPVDSYQIFDRLDQVPQAVFQNGSLVVERFLPEMDGELFCVRHCMFLGDQEVHRRLASPDPVVKGASIVSRDVIPPNEEISRLRRQAGWDYGKWDYVVRNGQAVLLDANRTPGSPTTPAVRESLVRALSRAIGPLLSRSAGTR